MLAQRALGSRREGSPCRVLHAGAPSAGKARVGAGEALMPTDCGSALFEFTRVEGRAVIAGFDGGAITSDAGALLLGATDRAIGLGGRFAACFRDARAPERVE